MPNGNVSKLFGTDGIRGVAGEFPLDRQTVRAIGESLTRNFASLLNRPPRVVVGRDTRQSGQEIENAFALGVISAGGRVESAGVITTPGVAYVTRVASFDAGVVISASHNPFRDNGIKVFSPSGKKLADEMERKIEEDLARISERHASSPKPRAAAEPVEPADYFAHKQAHYQEQYLQYLASDVGRGLSLDGMKVALDCANGAASAFAPRLFKRLGAQVEVLSDAPDGRNINEACGSLYPEAIRQLVTSRKLDLGIAFDGDADRALFIDATGALVDGDHALLILADYLKSRGLLAGNLVVATVMSNIGLEIALRERGIEMARAQVGDRYVLEELLARGAKLGGEQSGHIIFPDISLAGDGMITAIETLRALCDQGRTLAELASQLKRFPQVLVNVRVRSKPPIETLPDVTAEIASLQQLMQGRGRLLVRYSGTENLARVMIEGENQAVIEEQANYLARVIKKAIG